MGSSLEQLERSIPIVGTFILIINLILYFNFIKFIFSIVLPPYGVLGFWGLAKVLFEAWGVASDLFGLSESMLEETKLQDILRLASNNDQKEEAFFEMNNSVQSDSSQITNCTTNNSSPIIPSHKHKTSDDDEDGFANARAFEVKKQKCLQKKRKIICKRKLE